MSKIVLLPSAAVDRICHDEQMVIWAGDVTGALSIGDFLRDLDYSEGIELQECLKREIRSIIRMALDHPEARTFYTGDR